MYLRVPALYSTVVHLAGSSVGSTLVWQSRYAGLVSALSNFV